MKGVYLGIDLGTSAVKLLAVTGRGEIAGEADESYPAIYPASGMCEQSPYDWIAAISCAMRKLDLGKGDVLGIAVGGQMHGSVVLDGEGRSVRPCILWNDGRAHEETKYLNETVGEKALIRMTGNIAFAGFTAPKLMWIKRHEPENFARIRKIMLPKDYVVYRLTGSFTTDMSDASGTLLYDVGRGAWSEEMCRICSADRDMLPEALRSFEIAGRLSKEGAELLGLETGIPVMAGAADNAAAATGTGAVGTDGCNISLGTSGTVFICTDGYRQGGGEMHSFRHADGGYHLMGCMLSAAECNRWWTQSVCRSDYASEQADMPAPGSAGVLFLPYMMGERSPHNDTDARSAFIGMRPSTTRAEMGLAVMEGVSFGLRDILERAGVRVGRARICGGGARSALWRKITASALGLTLETVATEKGPAYGAALLAMTGCGEYNSLKAACDACVKVTGEIPPDDELRARYDELYKIYAGLYPALRQTFRNMRGI